MPYTIAPNSKGESCVFRKGANGEPTGDTLGCHPTKDEAVAQIGAIESNEARKGEMANDSLLDTIVTAVKDALGLSKATPTAADVHIDAPMQEFVCGKCGHKQDKPGVCEKCGEKIEKGEEIDVEKSYPAPHYGRPGERGGSTARDEASGAANEEDARGATRQANDRRAAQVAEMSNVERERHQRHMVEFETAKHDWDSAANRTYSTDKARRAISNAAAVIWNDEDGNREWPANRDVLEAYDGFEFPVRRLHNGISIGKFRNGFYTIYHSKEAYRAAKGMDIESATEQYTYSVPIAKQDATQQKLWAVVLEPYQVDAQGDWLTEGEIEKACHEYMENWQQINLKHAGPARKDIRVVESYVAPTEFQLGEQPVKKGSWVMAVHVLDKNIWQQVEKGELSGFSIEGYGRRIKRPVAKQ